MGQHFLNLILKALINEGCSQSGYSLGLGLCGRNDSDLSDLLVRGESLLCPTCITCCLPRLYNMFPATSLLRGASFPEVCCCCRRFGRTGVFRGLGRTRLLCCRVPSLCVPPLLHWCRVPQASKATGNRKLCMLFRNPCRTLPFSVPNRGFPSLLVF